MGDSNTERFKKDWITILASTSGIMLTISLMILTILYTTSIPIYEWQKMTIAFFILFACVFLMRCSLKSLKALGTLINASAEREQRKLNEANELDKLTGERALQGEFAFKVGLWLLIPSIFFSFLFFNWSNFGYILRSIIVCK